MSFEIVSEEGADDYEIWTCDVCGHSICLSGVGGDVAECPECIGRECSVDDRESQGFDVPDEFGDE